MDDPRCKVCRFPGRRRLIEADWADGMSGDGIAKSMTDSGWPITGPTVIRHLKEHAGPEAAIRVPPKLSKRDANVWVRDRVMDRLEALDNGNGPERQVLVKDSEGNMVLETIPFDILDKDLQPALGSMLKAQGNLDKLERDKSKQKVDLLLLMLGGADGGLFLSPLALTEGEDEDVIEGTAVEVDDE